MTDYLPCARLCQGPGSGQRPDVAPALGGVQSHGGWRNKDWPHTGMSERDKGPWGPESGERLLLANLEGCMEAEASALGLVGGKIHGERTRGSHST